ncbi:UbiA-like polyprenyltransferase [Leadbettera azotonutricia]|uniref:Putative 4-hydroxybenzoate polyprenyltransferase n=1 Tax=Leadbettera azotonutricia (strain ATCC BAA-888 / DSM 13862 / ZAS-9) TaxID=545695 RepID=F5YBT9_LEAAZ|nr:UbiA-like polyprenyltransferase [Leadbettera azotonutricia]AEF81533.1 putative 4-hydroxybenzoate polyprenyltransferase [Leadbettera azotonutricia ZAS-9]
MAFSIAGKLRLIGDAVIFRHTLFSLPFAATAILLESGGAPPLKKVILILLAAAAGRNAANALNRVIDADIDKKNPRTANRHLPQGLLSKKALLLFSLCMGIILIVAAVLLNPLCVILLPLAGILVGGYSFSKRFTWLCHYWLGLACAIAPMGSFIGLTGHFAFRYFVLASAHALWVAGFDILYALQDIEFDRREGLYSIPARFGAGPARFLAIVSHLGTLLGLFLLPLFWPLSSWYFIAAGIAGALLVAEHLIALGGSERHIRIASYSINEILPLIVLAGTVLGIYF